MQNTLICGHDVHDSAKQQEMQFQEDIDKRDERTSSRVYFKLK